MKRPFDLLVAGSGLALLSPVLVTVAVLVRLRDGTPILFRQQRVGRDGRPFELLKFRTMSTESEDPTTDGERITDLGQWLRSTSVDELPTLINVVRGDMSIVGPRPLPVRYLTRYSPVQARRHEVRPGITGLAQVCGRNTLGWDERFALDVEYVDTVSFTLDLRILLQTVRAVVRRDGISAQDHATMPEFWGSS